MTLYDASTVTYSSAAVTYDGGTPSPSPYPLPGIYIAFDDNPYTASPAWTEITQYVRGFSTHRGRSSDFDQFDTGTAQLVLDNRDRRFDPFYSSGPYFGKLLPRRQLRIIGQAGGTNYDVFRGYIAGWPVTWSEAGKDSTVTIQAFDALGLMANEIVPTDWLNYYTREIGQTFEDFLYFPCNETRPTSTISGTTKAGTFVPTLTDATSPAAPFFEVPSQFPGVLSSVLYCNAYFGGILTGDTSINNFGFSSILQFDQSAFAAYFGFAVFELASPGLYVNITYYFRNVGANLANTLVITTTSLTAQKTYTIAGGIPTGQQIHFVMNWTAATDTAGFWINGRANTPTTATAAPTFTPLRDRVTFYPSSMAVAQLFYSYKSTLSADQIGNLWNYITARQSETTTARLNRLIGTTEFPATLTSFTASPVATVSEIGSGAAIVPEMQIVADSEGGELYVSKDGKLTSTARFDVFNAPKSATVQATITDSGSGLEYGTELVIEYDADNLKNDITIVMGGGGEVNAYSDALIETYGGAATTIETQLADPTSANQLALLELGVEGALVPRISPIDLTPNIAASDWQTILGLELLDRVTFKRTPTVGNQFSRDALINAIDHQVVPGVWNTQVTLSMRYTSPLTLDDDVLGTLDFNYLG